MEILELLVAAPEFCGCFLELFALGTSGGAAATGVKARQRSKVRKEARAHGEEPPKNPYAVWFVVLVFLAVFAVGLVAFKWLRALP